MVAASYVDHSVAAVIAGVDVFISEVEPVLMMKLVTLPFCLGLCATVII